MYLFGKNFNSLQRKKKIWGVEFVSWATSCDSLLFMGYGVLLNGCRSHSEFFKKTG